MPDRTKLLVHLRRLSGLLSNAFSNGPDGTLEGKAAAEHPAFVHHACGFYLAGCLAYLEGEGGDYSWHRPSASSADFDAFVAGYPKPPKECFHSQGIHKTRLNALAEVRHAVVHSDGDLAKNKNRKALAMVTAAHLPGVTLAGSVVSLEADFLGFVRLATLAVRNFHGEF